MKVAFFYSLQMQASELIVCYHCTLICKIYQLYPYRFIDVKNSEKRGKNFNVWKILSLQAPLKVS